MASVILKALTLTFVVGLLASVAVAQDVRQDPKQRKPKPQLAKPRVEDDCGTTDDIAKKVEVCAKPLMDILQGTIEKWPRNTTDIQELCTSFGGAEKCIRDVGRRCGKGLHKTIISTIASSVARARKRECTVAKYPGLLRTTLCVEKYQTEMQSMILNITARLLVIEHKMVDLDKKTTAICCVIRDIEDDIRSVFYSKCPAENVIVTKLYRAVLEDVIELICRKPNCVDIFKGYKIPKATDYRSIISTLLRIVFSLG